MHMSVFDAVSFKSEFSKMSLEDIEESFRKGADVLLRNRKVTVTLKYADECDYKDLAHVVREQRLLNDTTVVPWYIESAVAQRGKNGWDFFDEYWFNKLQAAARNPKIKAVKAIVGGQIIGVSRFEAYDSPDSADIVTAIKATMDPENVKPSFDLRHVNKRCTKENWISKNWGELHQYYMDISYHDMGLGSVLFDCATLSLGKMGCDMMLINALSDNYVALDFDAYKDAILGARITEHNTRNNKIFNVPCDLLAVPLQKCSLQ